MVIKVTIQSNESNQKTVFKVGIVNILFDLNPNLLDKILSIAEKLTNYKVKITLGPRKDGKGCIDLIEFLLRIPEVKFYKYENKKVTVEEKHKLVSFCDKPFTCEYVKCIGCTFFKDINRKIIIKYVCSTISSMVNQGLHRGAISYEYYCRGHFSVEYTNEGWTLFEIIEKKSIEKVKIVEK